MNSVQTADELKLHSEILRNMAEGVYLIRQSDGVIVYTNNKFDKMFGDEPEFLDHTMDWLYRIGCLYCLYSRLSGLMLFITK